MLTARCVIYSQTLLAELRGNISAVVRCVRTGWENTAITAITVYHLHYKQLSGTLISVSHPK